MDKIKLLHGDCLELMKEIPDKSVDLILTDPPYGTTACKWDSVIPFEPMWEELERVVKDNGAILLFGAEPYSSLLRTSNLSLYKYDWKWEKPSAANFLNFKFQPAKVHEDICVFAKMASSYSKRGNMSYNPQMESGEPYTQKSGKQKTKNSNTSVRSDIEQVVTVNTGKRYPRSVQRFSRDRERLHPTQKPVDLLEYLIKTYTNEGDTVLDFTMGSGSTGVACVNTNRNFIGIELDDKYFEIAKERIESHEVQNGWIE